jgi:hypothetical protein
MPGTREHKTFDKYLRKRGVINARIDFEPVHKMMDVWQRGDRIGSHHRDERAHDPAFIRALVMGEELVLQEKEKKRAARLLLAVAEHEDHLDDFIMAALGHAALDLMYKKHHLRTKRATVTRGVPGFARARAFEFMVAQGWCAGTG